MCCIEQLHERKPLVELLEAAVHAFVSVMVPACTLVRTHSLRALQQTQR
jgi:hypothetical protein